MGHRENMAMSRAFSTLVAHTALPSEAVVSIQCESESQPGTCGALRMFFPFCAKAVLAEQIKQGKCSVKDWLQLEVGRVGLLPPL